MERKETSNAWLQYRPDGWAGAYNEKKKERKKEKKTQSKKEQPNVRTKERMKERKIERYKEMKTEQNGKKNVEKGRKETVKKGRKETDQTRPNTRAKMVRLALLILGPIPSSIVDEYDNESNDE